LQFVMFGVIPEDGNRMIWDGTWRRDYWMYPRWKYAPEQKIGVVVREVGDARLRRKRHVMSKEECTFESSEISDFRGVLTHEAMKLKFSLLAVMRRCSRAILVSASYVSLKQWDTQERFAVELDRLVKCGLLLREDSGEYVQTDKGAVLVCFIMGWPLMRFRWGSGVVEKKEYYQLIVIMYAAIRAAGRQPDTPMQKFGGWKAWNCGTLYNLQMQQHLPVLGCHYSIGRQELDYLLRKFKQREEVLGGGPSSEELMIRLEKYRIPSNLAWDKCYNELDDDPNWASGGE